jgi:prepilin-type N-terminal cleavage/methylation domain-containing protein
MTDRKGVEKTLNNRRRGAFTLIEMVVVVALIAVVLGLATAAWLRAKHVTRVIKEGAVIKSKLDDAIIRGAVKAKDYEFYRQQMARQIKSGLDGNVAPP